MPAPDNAKAIEVRVEEIAQLFDTLDPFPFRERDLDKHAEEYIVSWARELPRNQPIKIIIHAPENELRGQHANQLVRHSAGISIIAPRLSAAISTSCFV